MSIVSTGNLHSRDIVIASITEFKGCGGVGCVLVDLFSA